MRHQPRARLQAGAFRIDPSEPMGWLHMPPQRVKPPLPGATGSSSHATGRGFIFSAAPNSDESAGCLHGQNRKKWPQAPAPLLLPPSHTQLSSPVPEPCFHITPAKACNSPSCPLTRLRPPVCFLNRSPLSTALTPDTSLPKSAITQSHN